MYNPLSDKLMPWRIAQIRINTIKFLTLPMVINEQFWQAWSAVMFPEPKR